MLNSSFCDYSDAYIAVKGTVPNSSAVATNNGDKKVIFKNWTAFTDNIIEKNNTEFDNAKEIYVVMPVYNLIEYSDNYLKTSWSLWQYYRDEPALNTASGNFDFPDDNNSASLNLNKENWSKKKWWNKICFNNSVIKISKQFLENSRNVINWFWN